MQLIQQLLLEIVEVSFCMWLGYYFAKKDLMKG